MVCDDFSQTMKVKRIKADDGDVIYYSRSSRVQLAFIVLSCFNTLILICTGCS